MKLSMAASIVLVAVSLPRAAQAQADDKFSWGVSAGAAFPAQDLAKDHNTGFNAGVTFAFGGIGQLVGIRLDGMVNRFENKSGTSAGDARISAATFNLVVGLLGDANRVYLTGGIGAYGFRPDVAGENNRNDWGLNGGLGLWLPGFNGFVEARYHHFYRAFADKSPAVFVPVTLGILF